MKQLILFALFLSPFLLFSQSSGEIVFEETIKLDIELPEGMEAFKDQIPSSQNFKRVLVFNDTESIYKSVAVEEKDVAPISTTEENSGMQMRIAFDRPNDQMYRDLESGQTLEKQAFMGKKFLIEGEEKRYKWKITGAQKTILDYSCQKAVYKDTSRTVIAWFTTQIPVSSGPASYSGLTGMILEMDMDNGQQTIVATKAELKALENDAIKKPKKGKKVSAEEFKEIVEAKTKEMQEEFGGSGNVIWGVMGNEE